MPIGLINVYSTRNLGDAAILTALTRLSPDGQAIAVVPDRTPLPIAGLSIVQTLPAMPAYVSVGGDIFNNARPKLVTRQFLHNLRDLWRAPSRTIVFGQSIPRSCQDLSFRMLAGTFRRLANVTVRDVESYRRLREAGVPVTLGFDAAFALEAGQSAQTLGAVRLRDIGLDPARTVLLSLRGFDSLYPVDQDRFLGRMANLAERFHAAGLQPAVLIQADAIGADSDRGLAAELKRRLPFLGLVDLLDDVVINPVDALIQVLAAAEIVVAVRYHTAVLRLLSGRPPVVLSYSNKTRDLCDRLGLPGFEADDFDPSTVVQAAFDGTDRTFDPRPQRIAVREHFDVAMAATGWTRPAMSQAVLVAS